MNETDESAIKELMKQMSKAELIANLRKFPTATVSGNKEDLAKRLYFFRKRPERPKIVLDVAKIRHSLEPRRKIFDVPKV